MNLHKKEWLIILKEHSDEIQNKTETVIERLGPDKYPVPYNLSYNLYSKYYYDKGVIKKEDLIDGAIYFGLCRNSGIAAWDARESVFWYLRVKFDNWFFEKINHISDDDGYDLFLPIELYTKPESKGKNNYEGLSTKC